MADTIFTYGPDNVAELLATTMSKRPKKDIMDSVFNDIPTFEFLNSEGRVLVDGGATILVDLEVASNTGAKFYSGYDTLDTSAQDNHTTAQYTWKQGAVPVTISGRQARIQNAGESRIHNLLMAKQNNAIKSLRDTINTKMHGASNTSKEIQSLVTLIDATSTIGDINSTSNSYWQSLVTAGGVFASQGVADWRTEYNTLRNRGGRPNKIITTQTLHEAYEATMTPQIRYDSPQGTTADTKFRDLAFAGAMVRFDDDCASGVSYFLDSDVLHLYVHSGTNFILEPFVRPPDQDARVSHFLVGLELATSNRRRLGKVTGQS